MPKIRSKEIIHALNTLDHEALSHRIFATCFTRAIKSGEITELTKSSLFRCTLAYFLLVPDARRKFLEELSEWSKRKLGDDADH
jgi:hypothetical protein